MKKTFDEYAELEPQLLILKNQAVGMDYYPQSEIFCAHSVWYGHFKPAIAKLVGKFAVTSNFELRTGEAYDCVYNYLYDFLPACNHDEMMCWSLRHDKEASKIKAFLKSKEVI